MSRRQSRTRMRVFNWWGREAAIIVGGPWEGTNEAHTKDKRKPGTKMLDLQITAETALFLFPRASEPRCARCARPSTDQVLHLDRQETFIVPAASTELRQRAPVETSTLGSSVR
jgi:hypothetical protein